MKSNLLWIVTTCVVISTFAQKQIAKRDVLSDLDFLHQSLEDIHIDLYAYITKDAFNAHVDAVRSSISKDSLSLLKVTSLLQSVISKVNNGHTEIFFPGASYGAYATSGGTLFPLELAFENGKALVRKNWSANDKIQVGDEVLSIDNVSIRAVLENIFPHVSAERNYFKLAKMELISFPRLFWQAFGEQKDYSVKIRNDVGELHEFGLRAVQLIEGYEMKRQEIFDQKRHLKFMANEVAYLNPGHFSGNEEAYKHFIDSTFTEINKNNVSNLIIDLRNNLGGDDTFSNYLVSYIANKPFKWCSEFKLKTSAVLKNHVKQNYDVTSPFWQSIMTHANGTVYPYSFELYMPQPVKKRYIGQVYVLINRQTHSQAAVTAAQIQDYGLATVVGEETGDFPSLYASQFSYVLPKTGIEVKVAKGHITRVNGSKKPEGVIPDICINDRLLDETDEILDGLLRLIKTKS